MNLGDTQANPVDLSFVLLTWNSERYIEKCLGSMLQDLAHTRLTFEIHIVDNGSTDATPGMLTSFKNRHPQIFPIFLDRNTGTTYSRNLALKKAQGRFIFIMDSDVEIAAGTIEHLIEMLRTHPRAGIVAPCLRYPSGKLQKSTDVFPTVFTKLYRYFFLRRIEAREATHQGHEEVHTVDYAISAVWAMRAELLSRVGLLDEKIFYAPEDVDYCLRVWKAGYSILYDSGIACIHHTQEISRGFKLNRSTWRHIQGLFYYFRKHGYFFLRPAHIRFKDV